jgi:uncharacterized protein (TIGR02300 family)
MATRAAGLPSLAAGIEQPLPERVNRAANGLAAFAFDTRPGAWQTARKSDYSKRLAMATKEARGTKRTCQNEECGSRFYDLNRSPILCPICGSPYVIASAPGGVVPEVPEPEVARKPKVPEFVDGEPPAREDAPEVESTEALAEIEAAEEAVPAEEDETFLEEEEEGGDVSEILGPVAEDEEEP